MLTNKIHSTSWEKFFFFLGPSLTLKLKYDSNGRISDSCRLVHRRWRWLTSSHSLLSRCVGRLRMPVTSCLWVRTISKLVNCLLTSIAVRHSPCISGGSVTIVNVLDLQLYAVAIHDLMELLVELNLFKNIDIFGIFLVVGLVTRMFKSHEVSTHLEVSRNFISTLRNYYLITIFVTCDFFSYTLKENFWTRTNAFAEKENLVDNSILKCLRF